MKTWLAVIAAFGLTVAFVPAARAGWFAGTIANVQVGSDGWILLFLNATSECGGTEAIYTKTIYGNDDAKAILAMLLAWQAEGTVVRVAMGTCSGTTGTFTAAVNN